MLWIFLTHYVTWLPNQPATTNKRRTIFRIRCDCLQHSSLINENLNQFQSKHWSTLESAGDEKKIHHKGRHDIIAIVDRQQIETLSRATSVFNLQTNRTIKVFAFLLVSAMKLSGCKLHSYRFIKSSVLRASQVSLSLEVWTQQVNSIKIAMAEKFLSLTRVYDCRSPIQVFNMFELFNRAELSRFVLE